MKSIHYYQLNIIFDTPIISQAVGTLAFGLDAAMQRDNENIPVLSGSLVRGNIRHVLEEFQQLTNDKILEKQIIQWFGSSSETDKKTGSYKFNERAKVTFDFFWKLNKNDHAKVSQKQRTRIRIDSIKGNTEEGALQVIEDCFPLGTKTITFTGKVAVRLSDNESAVLEKWLRKALDYIPAMGSFKGVGFGRIETYQLESLSNPYQSTQEEALVLKNTRFGIQLVPDSPFCLGRPRTPDSHRIISSDIIKGNVIKALIARAYNNDTQRLEEDFCFNQLIITHALACNKGEERQTRVRVPALSYALIENECVDFAYFNTATLHSEKVPAFAPDWKDSDKKIIHQASGIKAINYKRYLSVKIGIDAKYGTSKEAQLFSLDCIVPQKDVFWCADIELCNIPHERRQQVADKLQILFNQGLHGIGKTKASACVTTHSQAYSNIPDNITVDADNIVTIDLVSSVKMFADNVHILATNSATALKEQYQAYWQFIHPDIELVDYFAQQVIQSSYYHRYQRQHKNSDSYRADYLTTAGSVFKLKMNTTEAKRVLQQYLKAGLPCYGVDSNDTKAWQKTPYLPEHGYGEIALHQRLTLAGDGT